MEIDDVAGSGTTSEADLKAATAIRKKELADFDPFKKELVDILHFMSGDVGWHLPMKTTMKTFCCNVLCFVAGLLGLTACFLGWYLIYGYSLNVSWKSSTLWLMRSTSSRGR